VTKVIINFCSDNSPKGVKASVEANNVPRITEAIKTGPIGVPHLAQIVTHAAPPTAPTTVDVVPATVFK
jgi:hypothetical protein